MNCSSIQRYRPLLKLVFLAPFLAAALILSGCSKEAVQAERRMAVPVLVAKAQTRDVPVQVTGIGTVEAYSTVSVKSLVAGALDEVDFTEGQEVRKDALLFTIDPRPFQADLQRAEANLARDTAQKKQAEANVARDQANAQNAAIEKRRYEVLYQKGVIAKEVFDQYSTSADALDAAVRADQAAVENANEAIRADQAAIEEAKLNLEYCYIRSPLDGRTGAILVKRGNIVKVNDTTLVVINQVHPINVDFSVPERDLPVIRQYVAKGKVRVDANVPNSAGASEQGTLSFIDNSVNSTTGTILLKGIFENQAGRLWPGQFVNVTVTLTTQPNVVVVPSQAIQTGQAGQYVFVVKPDMTVESRPVIVGRITGDQSVIEKGLQPRETVVTDGQIRLVPGALVQVKTAL
ncbi:MAG: efflux RND transporter periplasmic adaptor subunit [Acidobacteriia bacterium]|nr:efflux RND transporter periplasmic adaptor subunit [Terriglobia bacterium]